MPLPKKALRENQLVFLTAGAAINDGSHQTFKVRTIVNNVEKEGFFKRLAPEKDYPELLAKMSVATSVIKRLFQGKRSAEERLVFDENDKLVGTLSFNLEGFKPFNFASENLPDDPVEKQKVIPSTKTLVDNEVIDILIGRWFLHDDDVHPHNMSLVGDIDFDMFWYWFTIYMKGERPIIGVPNTRINLTVGAWEQFPNLPEESTKPFHWPTYSRPGQTSLNPIVPGANQLLTTMLPKKYPEPRSFERLAGEKKAQEQKLAAALKILLTYQPEVIRKRLYDYFGDMTLNYSSLDEALRTMYEAKFPTRCNAEKNVESFIDFMMDLYQEHYDNLYRVVVFYVGCENNGYGLSLQPTSQALYFKPSYFKSVLDWVKAENETTYKNEPTLQLDIEELTKRYHQVWRDAYTPGLRELLYDAYSLTNGVLKQASSSDTLPAIEKKDVTDSSITKSWQLFGSLPELSIDALEQQICVDKKSNLREALLLLIGFTNKLRDSVRDYYGKERADLSNQDNFAFASKLGELHREYNLPIRQKLHHTTTHAEVFHRIASHLEQISKYVNFQIHLISTDSQMMDTVNTITSKKLLPLTDEAVVQQFTKNLFAWAKGLNPTFLSDYIKEIIEKRYQTKFSNRWRADPVKRFLESSMDESGDNRLAYIFSSGKEDLGALNTLLVRHLTPLMLQQYTIPSIAHAISDDSFFTTDNLELYTKKVVYQASHSEQYAHLNNERGISLFYTTMYQWLERLNQDTFKQIIANSLNEYEKGAIVFFGNRKRRSEVNRYLAEYSNQAKIVAFIFLHGEPNSSLSQILFRKIVDAIKMDVQTEELDVIGHRLIKLFDHDSDMTIFKQHLKTYAQGPSNIQDRLAIMDACNSLTHATQ